MIHRRLQRSEGQEENERKNALGLRASRRSGSHSRSSLSALLEEKRRAPRLRVATSIPFPRAPHWDTLPSSSFFPQDILVLSPKLPSEASIALILDDLSSRQRWFRGRKPPAGARLKRLFLLYSALFPNVKSTRNKLERARYNGLATQAR